MLQVLCHDEIARVKGLHTWGLLGKIICGAPKVHAQAMIDIWTTLMQEAERAEQGLYMTVRIGTVKTRFDAGDQVSFLSCEKGEIVYIA